jgi:hypothetical protein
VRKFEPGLPERFDQARAFAGRDPGPCRRLASGPRHIDQRACAFDHGARAPIRLLGVAPLARVVEDQSLQATRNGSFSSEGALVRLDRALVSGERVVSAPRVNVVVRDQPVVRDRQHLERVIDGLGRRNVGSGRGSAQRDHGQ